VRFNSKPFPRSEGDVVRDGPAPYPIGSVLCLREALVTAASLDPSTSDLVAADLVPNDLLTLRSTTTGSTIRVTATGEVDSSSAPLLRAELDAALDHEPTELVLDLVGVTFLDSAGLSVLAGAHRRATAQDARLRVLASGRAVIRPMQITGLWELLGAEQVEPGAGSTSDIA
jgi:anti-sigma B factor antagonist